MSRTKRRNRMMPRLEEARALAVLAALTAALAAPEAAVAADPRPDLSKVPGVVINHSPARSRKYIGSPSLAVLPDGSFVASHDLFGPGTRGNRVVVFASNDRGKTWRRLTEITPGHWSNLFVHRGALYLMGTGGTYGPVVIRKSSDGGRTWTEPEDRESGLLLGDGKYHCAPVPVVVHDGRIWRGMEDAMGPGGWGHHFRAFMMSAPVEADLLRAESWTSSNRLERNPLWLGGKFGGWLEGNAVVTPDGEIVDVLRVDYRPAGGKAAVIRISDDGEWAAFDSRSGFISFPGGSKKFTIRRDPVSGLYWSLANHVPERHRSGNPERTRNTVALVASPDLRRWTIRSIVLYHRDVAKHGFQYLDWHFDGDDIIAVSRTAFDDGQGGAHNQHDANYLTFHRFEDFRRLTMADSVIDPETLAHGEKLTIASGRFTVTARGCRRATLADDLPAFGNRRYVWKRVPEPFRGWAYTQTDGGRSASISVEARRDANVYVATAASHPGIDMKGWRKHEDLTFHYTDKARTRMTVFSRAVEAGETLVVPQGNWTGAVVLVPVVPSRP